MAQVSKSTVSGSNSLPKLGIVSYRSDCQINVGPRSQKLVSLKMNGSSGKLQRWLWNFLISCSRWGGWWRDLFFEIFEAQTERGDGRPISAIKTLSLPFSSICLKGAKGEERGEGIAAVSFFNRTLIILPFWNIAIILL